MRPSLRVLVVDDQPLARSGIVGILGGAPGVQVVGEAADGRQALDLLSGLAPDPPSETVSLCQ